MNNNTKHLDLGCGRNPRNPYNQDILFGVDILDAVSSLNFNYIRCNVILNHLPFEDNTFDSISAYDFIEHIPREIINNGEINFPFIHVMNEVYRVLKPMGKFYALTPAYPKESAFVDPTHVNFITKNTHKYFTEPHNWAKMYGFNGRFSVIRAKWCYFRKETNQLNSIKSLFISIGYVFFPRIRQHFIWEFQAIK